MTTDCPEVAAVTLKGSWQGQPFNNVLHFVRRAGAFDATSLAALETLLAGAVGVNTSILHWFTALDTGAVIDTIYLKTLDTSTPIEQISTVSIAGSSGGTDLPAWVSACAKFTTASATRFGRGRLYVPGLNTGMVTTADPDHLDPTWQASLATKLNDFVAAYIASATWSFVILSRSRRDHDFVLPYEEVKSASVLPRTSHQLRRRPVS